MTPDQAVRSGYSVIQSEMVPRGSVIVVSAEANHTGRPLACAHPLDFIRLAFPNDDYLARAMGYFLGRAYDRLDAITKRLDKDREARK